jgi:hypothetical protein
MEIVEQLFTEAADRASSPAGFLRLIQMLLTEVEKIDFSDPNAPRMYVNLLRAYVLVKRQLTIFDRRCENVAIDRTLYDDTFRRLKYAIRIKRDEAREFASKSLPPERIKELKRYAGTHMGFSQTNELTAVPIPCRDGSMGHYMGQEPQSRVYPRSSRSYTRTN